VIGRVGVSRVMSVSDQVNGADGNGVGGGVKFGALTPEVLTAHSGCFCVRSVGVSTFDNGPVGMNVPGDDEVDFFHGSILS
jgi:hypothetical protein